MQPRNPLWRPPAHRAGDPPPHIEKDQTGLTSPLRPPAGARISLGPRVTSLLFAALVFLATLLTGLAALALVPATASAADPGPPAITSISPNQGPVTGGTEVTITGEHLRDTINCGGTPDVFFGTTVSDGPYAVHTDTTIVAIAPAHAAETVHVTVRFGASCATVPTSADLYTYGDPVPDFPFTGFFQPVDNLPAVNSMNAGRAVPVKFSLGGDEGLNIFNSGYPASQQINCQTGDPIDDVEETVTAGNSSLQYNQNTGQYTYVWKTDKAWKDTCRQLTLQLTDGTNHQANFQFN